mmetsp:Transcript_11121/g.33332  ORF Transcript_11121/g.33332 Transcript_11121/m.33332 type:complete len:112 (-) Transcript_11121:1185-1520(-)
MRAGVTWQRRQRVDNCLAFERVIGTEALLEKVIVQDVGFREYKNFVEGRLPWLGIEKDRVASPGEGRKVARELVNTGLVESGNFHGAPMQSFLSNSREETPSKLAAALEYR